MWCRTSGWIWLKVQLDVVFCFQWLEQEVSSLMCGASFFFEFAVKCCSPLLPLSKITPCSTLWWCYRPSRFNHRHHWEQQRFVSLKDKRLLLGLNIKHVTFQDERVVLTACSARSTENHSLLCVFCCRGGGTANLCSSKQQHQQKTTGVIPKKQKKC